MEGFTISKSEKQTIYEIYRACRLCGAGGGYRMPIIQNIIDLDSSEVDLRQKIQECLQLEVRPDDRMPPLICELCVDKLSDFHDFLELARQTNVKTRTRLGLPIQTAKKGEAESTDCILGVTEPVYVKEDDTKKGKAGPKSKKIKKEKEVDIVKIENTSDSSRSSSVSSRTGRATRRAPSPRARRPPAPAPASAPAPAPAPASAPAPAPASAPATRRNTEKETRSKPLKAPETPKNVEVTKEKKAQSSMNKELLTLLQDNMKFEYKSSVSRSLKRTREEPPRPALLPKRANLRPAPAPKEPKEPVRPARAPSPPPPPPPPPARGRPGPRSRKPPSAPAPDPDPDPLPVPLKVPRKANPETPAKSKEPPKPQESPPAPAGPPFTCAVCGAHIKTAGAFTNHVRSHVPCFTKLANACNPCGKWFITPEEAAAHHRYHRATTFPYHCRRCFDDFRTLELYDDHIDKGLCVQDEPPASRATCDECGAALASEAAHRCPARGGKPGGKCSKCSKTYATSKTLKRHESQCGQRRAGDLIADPDVLRRLKPMQVRITRCDDLVARETGDHYDVSAVKPNYGLAKNYIYPYMKLPLKTKPLNRDSMAAIPLTLKDELATDYTHWDSDDSDDEIIRKVPSLSTLAIKKLFSKNLLGKVPRKRRKVKNEEFEEFNDVSSDINDIISSLGDMGNGTVDRDTFTAKIKDIIGCLDDSDVNLDDEASKISLDGSNGHSRDDKVCNMENSDSTKENIESNEHVDDNCEESSNVEASSEEPSNVEASGEEPSNVEASGEEPSSVEASGEESSHVEASSEEPSNVEASSEEPSNVEANTSNTVLDNLSQHLDDENEKVSRIETDVGIDSCKNGELVVSLLKSTEKESAAETEIENMSSIDKKNVNLGMETDSSKNDKELDVTLQKSNEKDSEAAKARDIENTSRVETEPQNLDIETDSSKIDKDLDVALEKSIENEREAGTRETEYMPINGFTHENDDLEVDKSNETKINEEIKQLKESPIKHSIEHLIGEDRNPDKYINEVISSIEDIIMNNRAAEMTHENGEANEISDSNLMDALDDQIGEKKERISDNDKITLEDLLPKENRHEELEDISDDDFNFDA